MIKIHFLALVVCLFLALACNLPTQEEFLDGTKDALWAIPLINDEITMEDIFTSSDPTSNSQVRFDDDGRVIVNYSGEVLRDPASVVFPPIFGIGYIPMSDTFFQLDLSQGATLNAIDSAVFLQDQLNFRFISSSTEPIEVEVWIEEIQLDGVRLRQFASFPGSPTGAEVEIVSPPIDLEGWSLIGNDNLITFHYDARTADGNRVEIDEVAVNFNLLQFSYLQGYFPRTFRPVSGSFIPINLYKRWLSGRMDFVDPKVSLSVENSFGFAVGTEFKEMTLETTGGEKFDIEAEVIETGIIFNYPTFEEMGEVKLTYFEFTKDNSNVREIFEDRIAKFNYNIDAIANPSDDPDFLGYMTSDSYYAVQLNVEVPLHLSVNQLKVSDTLDINLPDDEVSFIDTAELKLIVENNFPIDVTTQLYLMNDQDEVIDSIFDEGPIFLAGGSYDGTETLTDVDKQTYFIDFSANKLANLKETTRLLVQPTFQSTNDDGEYVWIYKDFGLRIKMGAKFSLE